ncbi:THAP domain-containing protein 2 [Agrilus planipennis]|uniref:THAP domain-containing protein 2 n=1 Tax=Agrilus planipennis TaxID=224129 RepID=A0A1W4WYQ3_AGRPL|nr:THAP domain-containing protein 2 [Agrilus planipennis]
MVLCAVPSCNNRSDSQNWKKNISNNGVRRLGGVKITFHRLPKDPEKRKCWMELLGINQSSFKLIDNVRVCSQHFETSCFNKRSIRKLLKADALPLTHVKNSAAMIQITQTDSTQNSISRNILTSFSRSETDKSRADYMRRYRQCKSEEKLKTAGVNLTNQTLSSFLHTDIKKEPANFIENTESLSLLTVKTEEYENPTIDVDPEWEDCIKTEEGINVKEESKNDKNFALKMDVKEEVESDIINEQEGIKRHRLFIVTQPSPVIEEDEIKEVIADPLQVIEPVAKKLSCFKPSISLRDIRTLTEKIPTHLQSNELTVPLKYLKAK